MKRKVLVLILMCFCVSCGPSPVENQAPKGVSTNNSQDGAFWGIYNADEHYLDIRKDLSPGFADNRIGLPKAKSIPIIGDWGSGRSLAFFDELDCKFVFYKDLQLSQIDHTLDFNCDGKRRQAIAGDWTGDGKTKVGIYFSDTGKVLLSLDNSGNNILKFDYGAPNEDLIAITGDWNNDGITTLGIWNSREHRFDLINQNASGVADISFKVKNDLNGYPFAILNKAGKSYVGLYSSEAGLFHILSLDSFEEFEAIEFGAKNSNSLPIFWR